MRRIMISAAGLALLFACEKVDKNALPRYMREQDRFKEYAYPAAASGEEAKALYLTAVSEGEILLFKERKIVARAPAGQPLRRHRARGGHIYSEAIEGHETVVFKDSEELFRYQGEETILGFAIRGEDIHTLGQRAGAGFSYRVNGREIYSDEKGRIVGSDTLSEWPDGAFSEDLHYAYSIPLGHQSSAGEYRVMQGASVVKIFESPASEAVFDIRVTDGEICVVKLLDNKMLEFTCNEAKVLISPYGNDFKAGIWIVPSPLGPCVKWCSRNAGKNAYWMSTWQKQMIGYCNAAYGEDIPDMLLGGNYVTVAGGKVQRVFSTYTSVPVEESRYTFTSPLCGILVSGKYHVALSDENSGSHIVVSGRTSSLPWRFPGYFTSIRWE